MINNQNHLRKTILKLIQQELEKQHLNETQLLAIFHILAFNAPVTYRCFDPMIPEEKRNKIMGYIGAGWFIEDHL